MRRGAALALVLIAGAASALGLAHRGPSGGAASAAAFAAGTPGGSAPSAVVADGEGPAGDRAAADRRAKQAFLELQFFTEGRGMHQVPEMIRAYDLVAPLIDKPLLERRWGFAFDGKRPAGLLRTSYRGMTVGVAGCAMCHSGRAAGRFVPGLGNKNIDVSQSARDVGRLSRIFMPLPLDPSLSSDWRRLRRQSISFADRLADPRFANETQGLVPVAFIRNWFFEGRGVPPHHDPMRASVKVPALWGYGAKRFAGSFCDGTGEGVGWAAAVELAAGQRPEVVRRYVPRLERAESIIADLLPPPYPFPIDRARAARGALTFANRCAGCHGDYVRDERDLPIYEVPRFVSFEKVRTDSARLDSNTPEFLRLVETGPLRDLMSTHSGRRGYFAPRLDGVWSRFPYLHNGSVPSLAAMLEAPERRPPAFSLAAAGEAARFDRTTVGLTLPASGTPAERRLLDRGGRGARDVYFTTRVGHGSHGHAFGTRLSAAEKRDLIEYLKTL
jgi:hypothetical protein